VTGLEHLSLALQSLRANALRGLLTALGVIIGVASLVTLTAISAGARAATAGELRRLGPNIILFDGQFVTQPDGQQSPSDRTLTQADLDAVRRIPHVTAVAPRQVLDASISTGRVVTTARLTGITPEFEQIHNYGAARGRLLTGDDERQGRQVIVLGDRSAAALFPGINPIGQPVRVLSREFTVVGIFAHKGSLGPDNLDKQAFVPLQVAKRVLFGGENVAGADVQTLTNADVAPVKDQIDSLTHDRHRIQTGRQDNFSTEDQATIVRASQQATSTFETLTLMLGVIALIVGGIGIMNIMLVSVAERTREIGIRKALGAEPSRIQGQFLTEALVLCVAGGILGLGLGVGISALVSQLAGWQTQLAAPTLGIAFASAIAVGLFFGYYPARRAARLSPAVAMRYD
jgi:putative ABC transport system permease protein